MHEAISRGSKEMLTGGGNTEPVWATAENKREAESTVTCSWWRSSSGAQGRAEPKKLAVKLSHALSLPVAGDRHSVCRQGHVGFSIKEKNHRGPTMAIQQLCLWVGGAAVWGSKTLSLVSDLPLTGPGCLSSGIFSV